MESSEIKHAHNLHGIDANIFIDLLENQSELIFHRSKVINYFNFVYFITAADLIKSLKILDTESYRTENFQMSNVSIYG